METKTIAGIAGGLALAFVLALAFQSLSAYREPSLLVINQSSTTSGGSGFQPTILLNSTAHTDTTTKHASFGGIVAGASNNTWINYNPSYTDGNFLRANGSSIVGYEWTFNKATVTSSSFYNTNPINDVIYVNASGGSKTVNVLANGNSLVGKIYYIKKIDSSANAVSIVVNNHIPSSSVIDGRTTISLTYQYQAIIVQIDAINSAKILAFNPSCSNGISCSGTFNINGSSLQNQETTVCSSAGGTTYVKSSTGGNCSLYGGTAGVGLTLTQNTNDNQYKTNFANGTGISITGTGQQTFTNTGVTSLTCTNTEFICSASTGGITLTGNWIKVCQSSLSSNQSALSCASFTPRKFLYITIGYTTASTGTAINPSIRLNGDSGNNYAYRVSLNIGADTTAVSTNKLDLIAGTVSPNTNAVTTLFCQDMNTVNMKTCYWTIDGSSINSVTSPPFRSLGSGIWNSNSQINNVTLTSTNGGTEKFASPTEITIWGHD